MKQFKQVLKWINENRRLLASGLLYAITMLNSVCAALGITLSFSNEKAYQIASAVLLVSVFIYGVWHNFSVSKEAKLADRFMHALKAGTVELEQAGLLINSINLPSKAYTYSSVSEKKEED